MPVKFRYLSVLTLLATPVISPAVFAADNSWIFGIGTGLASSSLDGDIGFATPAGGVIGDLDLSGSDTRDLTESMFGFYSFASKGPWKIMLLYGSTGLEDSDGDIKAEWDREVIEGAVSYQFYQYKNNFLSVIGGLRYTDHDWTFKSRSSAFTKQNSGDEWTDVIVGLSHTLAINKEWSWNNRVDVGVGESESYNMLSTGVTWMPYEHWAFNATLKYSSTEYGEKSDIAKSDFYYYDVDETSLGLGFVYLW